MEQKEYIGEIIDTNLRQTRKDAEHKMLDCLKK